MCLPADPHRGLTFDFAPIQTRFRLLSEEVRGFGAEEEPSQADVDATSAALGELYTALPAEQQAVLARLVLQASSAVG